MTSSQAYHAPLPSTASPNPFPLSPVNEGVMLLQQMNGRSSEDSKSKRTPSWEESLEELKQYKLEHGDCLVPGRYAANPALGRWVEGQRKQYQLYMKARQEGTPGGGAMNDDRIAQLEALGFRWTVRKTRPASQKPTFTWNQRLEQLKVYREENGDCLVPYHYERDPSLGRWISNQRIQYQLYMDQSSTYSSMTSERIAQLEALGFDWAPPRATGKRKSMSSGFPVAAEQYEAASPDDASFVMDNDDDMPEADGPLVEESSPAPKQKGSRAPRKRKPRKKKVPRGDSVADDQKRKIWNERFEDLKAYKEKHGDCLVPGRYTENITLGRWVETQRKQYHRYKQAKQEGKTDFSAYAIAMDGEDRITKLEEVGFVWSLRTGSNSNGPKPEKKEQSLSWNQRLEQLKAYKDENGNCLVPFQYAPDPSLGRWVSNQRAQYQLSRKAKEAEINSSTFSSMTSERIAQLEALGFEWAPRRVSTTKPKKAKGSSNKAPSAKRARTKKKRKACPK